MINFKMPELGIGNLIAKVPIIQGGMGVGVSRAGLASAVANAGGIGVISAVGLAMFESDFESNVREANQRALKKEIAVAKKMTDGILGVNIMVALSDSDDLVRIAMEEGIDIIFMGAGLQLKLPKTVTLDDLNQAKTKIVPIVSSARAAKIIFTSWARNHNHIPDAVVVEGPLAGGHLGFKKSQINNENYTLEKILPAVISAIKPFEKRFGKKIPVIVAGGIFTGSDIYKFIQLGADAVQMATRFVATDECDASIKFKKAYLNCKKEDIIIIDSPVGLPGRAVGNQFLNEVSSGERKPFSCPWKCLKTCDYTNAPYCIAQALVNAQQGKLEEGFTFAGVNAYRVNKIISVAKLMEMLAMEYETAVRQQKSQNQSSLKIINPSHLQYNAFDEITV